jgi:4'-phosphopantetheinyl transferase
LGNPQPDHLIAIAGGHAKVWIVKLEHSTERLREARTLLTAVELERCKRVIDPRRGQSLMLCRAALRQILASQIGVRPQAIELEAGPDGSPAVAGRQDLSFSLSHTRGFAAVAVSDLARVGVDIELVSRRPASSVVARVLSPFEVANVAAAHGREPEAFLAHWTAKEACAKALGGGLARNLHMLELRDALSEPALTDQRLASLRVRRLALAHGLIGALAARAR